MAVLVENVEFLAARQLNLISTAMLLRALNPRGVLAHPADLTLGEGA